MLVAGFVMMAGCGKNHDVTCPEQQAYYTGYVNQSTAGVTTHAQILQKFGNPVYSNVSGGASIYLFNFSAQDTPGVACGQVRIQEMNGIFQSGNVGNCDATNPPIASASTGIDCSIR